jgi:hypothetical protein
MSDRRYASWSDAENATIERMWSDGRTMEDIAAAMPGRGFHAVRTHVYDYISQGKLPSRRRFTRDMRTPEIEALFVRAVKGGIGIEALCQIFRCKDTVITTWKRDLGLLGYHKPAPAKTTPLRCLGWCGKTHESTWSGDRFCSSCKASDGWRSTGDMSLVGVRTRAR